MFEAPTYITGRALDEWNRLLPFMEERNYNKDEYLMPYTSYCLAVQHFEEAIDMINIEGLVVPGRNESVVKHPAFTVLKEANERIAQASRAFGFTPGDLKRLEVEASMEEVPSWAKGLA